METTFATRLCAWLKARGMKPAELARAVGVSRPTMFEWMKGISSPREDRLASIAAALGLSMAEFYGALPAAEEAPAGGEAA